MYKVGIIGCGDISQSHHKGFTATGRAQVTAAWDIDAQHLGGAAATWGAKACGSAEELIGSDVDVVAVCTPGFAHRPYVVQAAEAGKHILCEKPLALTLPDALAMQESVRKAGVTFLAGFNPRFQPTMVQLRDYQQAGRVGRTVSAWYRIHAPSSSARWLKIQQSGHWRASVERSGGRIAEFGSHGLNWLLWVLGPPLRVYGRALHVTKGFAVDDADYGLITCRGGVGVIEINRHAGVAADLNCGVMGDGGSVVLKDGKILYTPMDQPTQEVPPKAEVATMHAHLLDCIQLEHEPLSGIDAAVDTVRLCLAFNRSAQSGRVEVVQD